MTTAVARRDTVAAVPAPLETPLGQIIAPYRELLTPFIRDGHTFERVCAELALAAQKTPHLDECDPKLLVDAVSRALDTGGTIGQDVYLLPFKNKGRYEPSVAVDYKFKASMVCLAGGARSIDARVVYDDEHFKPRYGDRPGIDHSPAIMGKPGRKVIGAYAIAFHGINHHPTVLWMPLKEIEEVRSRSKQWSPSAGIKDCPVWYACKTAVHRVVKLLPKNPKLARVLGLIEREEIEEGVAEVAGEMVDTATGEILPPPARVMPVGPDTGKPLADFSDEHLARIIAWCEEKGGHQGAIDTLTAELESRRTDFPLAAEDAAGGRGA